jgi:tetratricopeptide (TPR) repeat protein
MPLIVLGDLAWIRGEYERAREYYLRSLKISERTGFTYSIQTSTKYLCKVALSLGDIAEAEKYLVQSIRISNEIGFVRDVVNLIYEYARLKQAQGFPERTVELLALVIQHPASQSTRMIEGRIRDSAEALLAALESELPQETFAAALARGRELDPDAVITALVGR